MSLKKILPIAEWLPSYKNSDLKSDLSAGLTVGVMLIPQGMAYAMLAKLPAIYGLYAATLPLILYAIFGTSRQLSVGPVAMASLLVASGLSPLISSENNLEQYIKMAVLLAFLVGIVRLLLGILRMGFLVNFISRPVINGYTSAAALIIGLSQLKHLLGIKIPNSNYIHEVLYQTFLNLNNIQILTLIIGIVGIVLLLVLKFIKKKYKIDIPGPLAVVFFGTITVWGFGLTDFGVSIIGDVPKGLPSVMVPYFDWKTIQMLIPSAFMIGIVGFMESISVAKVIQSKHKTYTVSANQELIALGIANMGGAFFQAFPVNGGFSRTAVNDQAGAKTPLAGVFSAVLVLLTLLFLTPLFYYLPQAVLASIVMVAVFNLIDIQEVKFLWKSNKKDLMMLIITFLATLFIGVVEGILVGVFCSLILLIYRATVPHIAILGKVPDTEVYRNISRNVNLEQRKDILIIRFDAELFFGNADYFSEYIQNKIKDSSPTPRLLIIDAESITGIDATAMYNVTELYRDLEKQNILCYWAELKGPVRDSMELAGAKDIIGKENFFVTVQDAVDNFDNLTRKYKK
jgi:SulP family sulfate permease